MGFITFVGVGVLWGCVVKFGLLMLRRSLAPTESGKTAQATAGRLTAPPTTNFRKSRRVDRSGPFL